MDDLTVILVGVAALEAGVLLSRSKVAGATTPSGGEKFAHLGIYPVGELPSSRQLAEEQVATGAFQPGDVQALAQAIEARRYGVPQTAGTHKLYPYKANGGMVDIGYQIRNGQRGPLSYVSYPVGGSTMQGTWRPI